MLRVGSPTSSVIVLVPSWLHTFFKYQEEYKYNNWPVIGCRTYALMLLSYAYHDGLVEGVGCGAHSSKCLYIEPGPLPLL